MRLSIAKASARGELTAAEAWRKAKGSTIRNMLGLARTSYLNEIDPIGKRKICQRILAEIRASRPALPQAYYFWLGEAV